MARESANAFQMNRRLGCPGGWFAPFSTREPTRFVPAKFRLNTAPFVTVTTPFAGNVTWPKPTR